MTTVPKFVLFVCLLPVAMPCQTQSQRKVTGWTGDDPYRNFIGTWRGSIPMNPTNESTPVLLTVTEDKSSASMIWHYCFGTLGTKHYKEADKLIVLSPADGKMLMHFSGEPVGIYDTAALAAFQKAGLGKFVAVIHYDKLNYWHVKHSVEARMTLDLGPDTLTYSWEIEEHGKSRPYSRFEFTRIPDTPAVP